MLRIAIDIDHLTEVPSVQALRLLFCLFFNSIFFSFLSSILLCSTYMDTYMFAHVNESQGTIRKGQNCQLRSIQSSSET